MSDDAFSPGLDMLPASDLSEGAGTRDAGESVIAFPVYAVCGMCGGKGSYAIPAGDCFIDDVCSECNGTGSVEVKE